MVATEIGLQKVLFSPLKTLPISDRIEGTVSQILILRQAQEELRKRNCECGSSRWNGQSEESAMCCHSLSSGCRYGSLFRGLCGGT